jgi:hypothetical protein
VADERDDAEGGQEDDRGQEGVDAQQDGEGEGEGEQLNASNE